MTWLQTRRPSASMIVALIALFVALGGSSYAAVTLAKNSVGSKQLKKNAVTTAKIKNGAVTGNKIKNGAVTGNKIKLSSLGTVPSAKVAGSAQNVKTWFQTATSGQTVTLLSEGPFTYRGVCGSSTAETTITTTQNDSEFNSYGGNWTEPFNPSSGAVRVGYEATSSDPWYGPYDGTDSALSGDGRTVVETTVSDGTGVGGVPCTFAGYAVVFTR
ncbi:MAG TPA: hypothetical protein VG405_07360 [Solirubrobacteraceae bacterium]|nr:hypothetical protein [Solirubrobacteraceae bacterium]